MKNKIWKILITILVSLVFMTSFSFTEESPDKKVVLITINEVNFDDLYSMKSVQDLIREGSIGLMNTKTSTRSNTYKAYVTLGAGVRAEGSSNSTRAANLTDESRSIYFRRTGYDIKKEGIVNLDIARLFRLNLDGEYGAIPGQLGQSLHNRGIKTAAIGNGDTEDALIRLGPMIAMDHQGYVDYGDVGQGTLIRDETYSCGLKSNYSRLIEIFKEVYKQSGLIVIDIGDIGRLERDKDNLTDEVYAIQKSKVLKDVDQYIQDLLNIVDLQNTRIMIVTPYSSSFDIKSGNKLTPIIAYGDGIGKGLLTSDTTRRTGIIGNIDVAPSIVQYLNTSYEGMSGKPFYFVSKANPFDFLMQLNRKLVSTSNHRYPILSTFAIFEILVSIAALIIILIEDKLNKKTLHWFYNILLSTMTVPFVLLILPLFKVNNLFITYFLLIFISFLITYITKKISKRRLDNILILSFLTTVGLLIDILNNGYLIKDSLLGYDPIIGARYYGVGNEYMGVLIGSTLVFVTTMMDRFKIDRRWAILMFLITTIIIGYPKLGANVGGTITAVAAFTFASFRLFKIRIHFKQFVLIGIAVVLMVGFMALIDIKLSDSQSHLAVAIHQITQEGPSVILRIIKRKIGMNLKLIGVTIWSKVLISTIVILATLFYRPVGTIYKLTKMYPNLAIGWTGIVTACVVGFFVNDSGVVAAATGIIFLAMSMLYLIFFIPKEKR